MDRYQDLHNDSVRSQVFSGFVQFELTQGHKLECESYTHGLKCIDFEWIDSKLVFDLNKLNSSLGLKRMALKLMQVSDRLALNLGLTWIEVEFPMNVPDILRPLK